MIQNEEGEIPKEQAQMLAYILSIVVAVFSLIIFGLAFFAPSLHRRDDFLWSGVGLFYALVLWLCASQFTGAVLLGQTAAAIMLLSFGWQTLKFRDAIAHPEKGIDLSSFSVIDSIQNFLGSSKSPKVVQPSTVLHSDEPPITETLSSVKAEVQEKASEVASAVEDKVSSFVEENKLDDKVADMKSEIKEVVADAKAATSTKEGFSFKKFLNFRKTPAPPVPTTQKTLIEEIDDFEMEVEQLEQNKITAPEPIEPEVNVNRFVPSDWVKSPLDPENIEINESPETLGGEDQKTE